MNSFDNNDISSPELNTNTCSISELKNMIKVSFSKIKNFILNLTKTINNDYKNLDEDIFSFSFSLLEVSNSLMKYGLYKEQAKLGSIQDMGEYILENSNLFNQYSYFITELLDLFIGLITHLGDKDYEEYYLEFSLKLKGYETFFRKNIFTYAKENEKKVFMLTREIWGSNQ